jgi:hypothetical protein
MCNCGNKRNEYHQQVKNQSNNSMFDQTSPKMWKDAQFKYTGKTALTVTGVITGKQYRFSQPGDIQTVDYRDAGAMKAVPALKSI